MMNALRPEEVNASMAKRSLGWNSIVREFPSWLENRDLQR